MKHNNTWFLSTTKGEIDLTVILWVKDNYEFYRFWNQTLNKFEDYFAKATISLYIQAIDYDKGYLFPEKLKGKRDLYQITCTKNTVAIDEIDHALLNILASNARLSLIDIAKRLGLSSQTVKYHMDNLIKKDVIRAFRVHLDYKKIKLQHFKIDIYLREHKLVNNIVQFLEKQPYLQCLNVAIGWADIEPEFVLSGLDELHTVIDELNTRFPNEIKKYSYWILEKRYKDRWLPEFS